MQTENFVCVRNEYYAKRIMIMVGNIHEHKYSMKGSFLNKLSLKRNVNAPYVTPHSNEADSHNLCYTPGSQLQRVVICNTCF